MKRVNNLFLVFLLSACLVGCCPCKRIGTSTNSVTTDSTWTKETKKPQIIDVPARKVDYSIVIECDSVTNKPKPVKQVKNENGIKTTHEVDSSGILKAQIECLSLKLKIDVLERENFRLRTEKETKADLIEVAVSHWYDVAARFVILFLLGIIFLQKFKIL